MSKEPETGSAWIKRAALGLFAILLLSIGWLGGSSAQRPFRFQLNQSGDALEGERLIQIEVLGGVRSPGVFELPQGSRVSDAVEAAGGLTREAEAADLNESAHLIDGIALQIPQITDAESVLEGSPYRVGAFPKADDDGRVYIGVVSLNQATRSDLESIKGIGPVIAGRILAYRQSRGGFRSIEELSEVKGIGPKTMDKLRPFLKL
jgi:competence protein ComEA